MTLIDESTSVPPPELAGDDASLVLGLWHEARERGWTVEVDADTRAWRATDPAGDAGMMYDPPGPVSVGVVSAHDHRVTLMMTGVNAAGEAVALLRGFLGWTTTAFDCESGSRVIAPAGRPESFGACCSGGAR